MNKIVAVLVISACLIAILGTYSYQVIQKDTPNNEAVYSGPVPLGFDEIHFRKTGETIPLEVKE